MTGGRNRPLYRCSRKYCIRLEEGSRRLEVWGSNLEEVMKTRRKSVNDINTINSPKVGRRKKQVYLQLHTLANRRKRLKEELERLEVRRQKAEKNLKKVEDHIATLLEQSGDVDEASRKTSSFGGQDNDIEY